MKRVVLIASSFWPSTYLGGSVTSDYSLYRALKVNTDCIVLTTDEGVSKKHKSQCHKDIIYCRGLFRGSQRISFSLALLSLKYMLYGAKNDIVILSGAWNFSSIFVLILSLFLKRRVFLMPHGAFDRWTWKDNNYVLKYLCRLVYTHLCRKELLEFLCMSKQEKSDVAEFIHPETAKIHDMQVGYIYNRVSSLGHSYGQDKLGFIRDYLPNSCCKRYFYYMGRIHPKKNIDKIISSFMRIAGDISEWGLIIAGVSRKADYDYLVGLGSHERIFIVPFLDDVHKNVLHDISDVSVLISKSENLGISALEALLAGNAVVCSSTCGVRDYIVDGVNGIVVENSTQSVSQALLEATRIIKDENFELYRDAIRNQHSLDSYSQSLMYLLG